MRRHLLWAGRTPGRGDACPSPGERKAACDEHDAEGEEGEVPAERGAEIVADVMEAEELVVDEALDDVEDAPAGEQQADVHPPGRRSSPRCQARRVSSMATVTSIHVAAWKNPSTSVFAWSPATVSIGSPPVSPVSMWCHWRIWCRTMPSTNPPSPRPMTNAGAFGGVVVAGVVVMAGPAYPAGPFPQPAPRQGSSRRATNSVRPGGLGSVVNPALV